MVDENFKVAYSDMINNNINEHTLKIYSLESSIRYAMENGKEYSETLVELYAKRLPQNNSDGSKMAVYNKKKERVFTNIFDVPCNEEIEKFLDKEAEEGASYYLFKRDEISYMIIASEITIIENKFWVIDMYNVNSVFNEKDRQLIYQAKLNIGVIAAAVICVTFLSMTITLNIKKLNKSSRRIADGEYYERTNVKSSDEIGELSKNFDTMASAVEEHIAKLEDDIHSREQFVSDFSHELKTPMTAIMGYSRMLINGENDENDISVASDFIYRECKRLELLSQKLLAMLRISNENIELSRIYCDWIANVIVKIIEPYTDEVRVETDIEEACIRGDVSLITDLFRNIIENAIRACNVCPDVDGVVRFTGKIIDDDNYMFSVEDNGIGISENNLSKVKEAFYMEDKSRSRESGGSGLGLSICDKICKFHNTELNIESEQGKGTIVSVKFGLYKLEEVQDEQAEEDTY